MAGLLGKIFRRNTAPSIRCAAVVPAAGLSARMEGQDKLLLELGDEPVLAHTLRALELCPYICEIVVVTRRDLIVPIGQLCKDYAFPKVRKVIVGGESRTQSVLSGLREVTHGLSLVAIHDGARPLVSQSVLEAAILRAAQCGAAAPAVAMKDTVKRASGGLVETTLDREMLFAVQTPQVFELDLIRTALTRALEDGAVLTDDCSAVERLGIAVALTAGAYENIKITTPEDLAVCEALLAWQE